jgi:hypothetical protein
LDWYSRSNRSVVGTAYTAAVNVTGGVAPYTTTVSGLPVGLSFDGSNIVGTPTVAGTFTVSVSTTDSLGVPAASAPITLTVSAPAITAFSATLPSATVGTAYSGSVSASGGYGALSYSAAGLPTGLTLSGKGISGIPTTVGTYSVAFTVTDALGTTASTSGNIAISGAVVAPTSCTLPTGAKSSADINAKVTAVSGSNIIIGAKPVTVLPCTVITWSGSWSGLTKAIRVGYSADMSKGYILNGVTYATNINVDNGL